MKKVTLLTLVFLALALTASAQDEEIKPNQEADRQAISNLEQGFAHAIQLNNSTIFNTVFSDDFSGVTWYGEVISKANKFASSRPPPTPTSSSTPRTFKSKFFAMSLPFSVFAPSAARPKAASSAASFVFSMYISTLRAAGASSLRRKRSCQPNSTVSYFVV